MHNAIHYKAFKNSWMRIMITIIYYTIQFSVHRIWYSVSNFYLTYISNLRKVNFTDIKLIYTHSSAYYNYILSLIVLNSIFMHTNFQKKCQTYIYYYEACSILTIKHNIDLHRVPSLLYVYIYLPPWCHDFIRSRYNWYSTYTRVT